MNKAARIYIHYLNRFTDVRQHWGQNSLKFRLWKAVYFWYIVRVFCRYGKCSCKEARQKTHEMIRQSVQLEGVSKELFQQILS